MKYTQTIIPLMLLTLVSMVTRAQNNAILSGNVRDQDNNPLELVNVAILGLS